MLISIVASIDAAVANTSNTVSLLDNRFRVDPSISQITFVVYRAKRSQPVVLVRPDGVKYYAWRSPENVSWYEESGMDIISIDDPMPGPWQAVGKVTPKNNIKLISHITLEGDNFPNRVYQGEVMKFTARLKSNDKPLVDRDFLDRVNLNVTFTKYVENEESLIKEARPLPQVIGNFADDGQGLDEVAGDGVFTVELPISVNPGKYRVRITSGNGVFLRAIEQVALVYPSPMTKTFIQSRKSEQPHQLIVSGEEGMIEPGSILVSAQLEAPDGYIDYGQGQATSDSLKANTELTSVSEPGIYRWHGSINATDRSNQRDLFFPIAEQSFSIISAIDLVETQRQQEEALERKRRELEKQRILAEREASNKHTVIIIVAVNLIIMLLGIVSWLVARKLKSRKQAMPEMQLEMPKNK
ncbi:TIGR03503 family protein [Vibrio maerlii]|uniref:TIGR03503 family protein n=1 Tax=Vibrio maerlii TaxID=2231648 RepID=UPI001F133919|nr:TIGR03503 family protein [Vibrio maerlii]